MRRGTLREMSCDGRLVECHLHVCAVPSTLLSCKEIRSTWKPLASEAFGTAYCGIALKLLGMQIPAVAQPRCRAHSELIQRAEAFTMRKPKVLNPLYTGCMETLPHSLEISSARFVAATTALMSPARTPLFSSSWYPAMVVPA